MNQTFGLGFTPDERVELIGHRRFRQVTAEFGEVRRILLGRERPLVLMRPHQVFANLIEPEAALVENFCGDRFVFAQDAQQQMLGADVPVLQAFAFVCGKAQDALGADRQRQVNGSRDLITQRRAPFDLFADRLDG